MGSYQDVKQNQMLQKNKTKDFFLKKEEKIYLKTLGNVLSHERIWRRKQSGKTKRRKEKKTSQTSKQSFKKCRP